MAAPRQGLLHEARLPVVLRATVRLDVHLHRPDRMEGGYFRVVRRTPQLLSRFDAFAAAMEPSDEGAPSLSPQAERPVFPPSPRPRAPEHELRDREKAAKLRHNAARARMKRTRLGDLGPHLVQKAAKM